MKLRTTFLLLFVGLSSLILASCNTVSGFGKDMQNAGEGIENSGEGRDW